MRDLELFSNSALLLPRGITWNHLLDLCISIILLMRGNNDQGETELQCVEQQVTSGSIEKWGDPYVILSFLSISLLYTCHYLNSFI